MNHDYKGDEETNFIAKDSRNLQLHKASPLNIQPEKINTKSTSKSDPSKQVNLLD